jgi:hypothetical protein
VTKKNPHTRERKKGAACQKKQKTKKKRSGTRFRVVEGGTCFVREAMERELNGEKPLLNRLMRMAGAKTKRLTEDEERRFFEIRYTLSYR